MLFFLMILATQAPLRLHVDFRMSLSVSPNEYLYFHRHFLDLIHGNNADLMTSSNL